MLVEHTIRPTNMVTEAFSGAQAPITHVGDHWSGMFPDCHVVPRSTFNLVAMGPYLDHKPNTVIIMTPTTALQLDGIDPGAVENASDPRANLTAQLQALDLHGNHRVTITSIANREGPRDLYHTNLFARPAHSRVRTRLVNSARAGLPLDFAKFPDPMRYLGAHPTTASIAPAQVQPAAAQHW